MKSSLYPRISARLLLRAGAVVVVVRVLAGPRAMAAGTFLFDATKAESAANADWVIDADAHNLSWSKGPANLGGGNESNPQRVPTPAASGINAFTSDTYWNGAFSSFGVGVVKQGFGAESLPYNGTITYGNSSNPQDLSHYSAFVLSEPNILFTAAEKTAILTYVKNGGGLIVITDHSGSDRNNDGKDSVAVLNDLMQNNSVQVNPFGVTDNAVDVSPNSTTLNTSARNPLTQGPSGVLTHLAYHNGSTFTIDPTVNPTVTAAAWSGATPSNSTAMAVYGKFGAGRFMLLGDTSPVDDGSGDPNDTSLFDGWDSDGGKQLMLNAANYVSPGIFHWYTTDGTWSNASNWFENALPGTGNDARIVTADSTSPTITYDFAGGAVQLNSLTVDNISYSTSTFQIVNNAVLQSNIENFGTDGATVVNQTGGTNAVGLLTLAANSSGSCTYNLSGGTLSVGTALLVGVAGYGNFTQTGGTLAIANTASLSLGNVATIGNSYSISAGTISAQGNEYIGNAGVGYFTQTGGVNSVGSDATPATLFLGFSAGSSGIYSLDGSGSLLASREVIGNLGTGEFDQLNGTNIIGTSQAAGTLTLGLANSGTYALSGGTLQVSGNEIISAGTFIQTGGTHAVGTARTATSGPFKLSIGAATNVNGAFTLNGGTLTVSDQVVVGGSGGRGTFNQSGGVQTIGTSTNSGSLAIGISTTGGAGTFTLSGTGSLLVNGNVLVGNSAPSQAGVGTLAVSGGVMLATGTLSVAPSSMLFLSGGSLAVGTLDLGGDPTRLNWSAGTLEITQDNLAVGPSGVLGASPSVNAGQILDVDHTVSIAGGATLNIGGTPPAVAQFHAGVLNNSGVLNLDTTNASLGTGPGTQVLSNSGSINLHSASLNVLGSANIAGTMNSSSSSIFTFNDGVTLAPTGNLQMAGGDRWTIAGGSFTNNSTVASTVAGVKLAVVGNGSQGIVLGTSQAANLIWGSLEIGASTSLSVTGGNLLVNDLIIDGSTLPNLSNITVINSGTISTPQSIITQTTNPAGSVLFFISTTGGYTFSNNATYTNAGIFNNETDQPFSGNGTFHNTGTFRKQASVGTTAFSVPFNNDGLLDVRSGTLSIQAGGTGSGSATVSSGAALEILASNFTSGDLVSNGTVSITPGSVANFSAINGTGTLNVTSASLGLTNASTVGNLSTNNATLVGSAPDNTTVQDTPARLTVLGPFQNTGNLTLNNGLALTLAGSAAISSGTISGGSNASVTIASDAVVTHDDPGSLNFPQPTVTIAGELDVNQGAVNIPNGGLHSGTIKIAAPASLNIAGDFSSTANIDDHGALSFYTSPGTYSNTYLTSTPGHLFSGTLAVEPGVTLAVQPIGTDPGAITFDYFSHVSFAANSSLVTAAGTTAIFFDQDSLNIGTATLAGNVTFLNSGLAINNLTVAGTGTTDVSFQTSRNISVPTLVQSGGIIDTGDANYRSSTVMANTYNFSGGELQGHVSVAQQVNWTGGVIDGGYGNLELQSGATMNITAGGGLINRGSINSSGTITTSGNLLLGSTAQSNAYLNILDGSVNIAGTLGAGNTGTFTTGDATAYGQITVSGGTLKATSIITGNVNGGGGALNVYGTGDVTALNGISGNVYISSGAITVPDAPTASGADPELSRAIAAGYGTSANIYNFGGTITAPIMKVGVSQGVSGGLVQYSGDINVGTLAVGNDGAVGSGVGSGYASIYGGTVTANNIIVGSTAGGSGILTIGASGSVSTNTLLCAGSPSVPGGTLTVSDGASLNVSTLDLSSGGSLVFLGGKISVNGGAFSAPASGAAVGDGFSSATLLLHNANVTNGSLTIAPAATFIGSGSIATAVTVNPGGTLAPGEGVGKMTFSSNLTLSTDTSGHSILQMEVGAPTTPGGTFDQIAMTGGIFTVGGANLQMLPLSGVQLNHAYPIVTTAGGTIDFSTAFANLTNGTDYNSGGMRYHVTYSSSEIDITFTAVPEPMTIAPAAALLTLLRRRRRDGK